MVSNTVLCKRANPVQCVTLAVFILFQPPAHFSFVVTYALIHINDDLALIPGVIKKEATTQDHIVCGGVFLLSCCVGHIAKRYAQVWFLCISVYVCVCMCVCACVCVCVSDR